MSNCANCNNELGKKAKDCEFCNNKICRECQGMSLCQKCYKDGCDNCLEQCPKCLERFCSNCIREHINMKFSLDEKIEKFKNEINISNLASDTKERIISKVKDGWFIEK
ncbi:MAG: hypothetical protein U9Q73_01775 [Nanoarchaeota archaeon]|nr:hypothetical protein [Nanoarchaeota archaeon]